jgi:hypothetical protein
MPPETPVQAERGKVVSAKGTFSTAARRGAAGVPSRTHASPVAFYAMPTALEALRASRGVVVTGPRFQGGSFSGHESPGPIFYPDPPRHIPGGTLSCGDRFPAPRPERGAKREVVVSSASSLLQQQQHSAASFNTAASPARSASASGARPQCTFGRRIDNGNSPWPRAEAPQHTHLPLDDGHRVPGGRIGTAARVTGFALGGGAGAGEVTPGPGHFRVPSALGDKGGFVGRKLRPHASDTPGPGSYDVRLADARLRRRRR